MLPRAAVLGQDQQFISRVSKMLVQADIATRLNGVEQVLALVRVAFVDVAVLSLAWAALCLRSQLVQEIDTENLHGRSASVAERAATICLTVFSTANSRSNKAVQRAGKPKSVPI